MSDPQEPYAGPGPNSDDFDPSQHKWDGNQWWTDDMQHWWDGAKWQSQGVPRPETPAVQRKIRPPGYWRDFWLGFFGVVAGNILLLIVISGTTPSGESPGTVASLAPWILNFLALVVFAIVRPRVALGMLTAYGVAFGLVLCGGIFLLVLCFGMSGGAVP